MRILVFLLFLVTFIKHSVNAQSTSIGQLAKTVYVNVKMPIVFNTGCSSGKKLNYQVTNGRVEQHGDSIFLIAFQKGKVNVSVFDENKIIAASEFVAKDLPPFDITIGDKWHYSIPMYMLKLETGLKCTIEDFLHGDDYKVSSATVYFSGNGFQNVQKAQMNSNSFEAIRSYLDKCLPGSVITFDNIKVIGPDGIRTADKLKFEISEY